MLINSFLASEITSVRIIWASGKHLLLRYSFKHIEQAIKNSIQANKISERVFVQYIKLAEEAGIEPAKAFSAHIGFEDRGGHQTPSTSVMAAILWQISVTGNAFFVIKKRELAIF
jgi:hypothetical protein